MRWITRERIRVGRIGCAWLITRFADPAAELLRCENVVAPILDSLDISHVTFN